MQWNDSFFLIKEWNYWNAVFWEFYLPAHWQEKYRPFLLLVLNQQRCSFSFVQPPVQPMHQNITAGLTSCSRLPASPSRCRTPLFSISVCFYLMCTWFSVISAQMQWFQQVGQLGVALAGWSGAEELWCCFSCLPAAGSLPTFPAVDSLPSIRSSLELGSWSCHFGIWFWHWESLTKANFSWVGQILLTCKPRLVRIFSFGNEQGQNSGRVLRLGWGIHGGSANQPGSLPCRGQMEWCFHGWLPARPWEEPCGGVWPRCGRVGWAMGVTPSMAPGGRLACSSSSGWPQLCSGTFPSTICKPRSKPHPPTFFFFLCYPRSFHLNVDVVITERRIPVFRDLRPQ